MPLDFPLDFGDIPSSGRVTIVNDGNAGAVTTLKVRDDTGQMVDGFTIVNVDTGETLTYVGTVTQGTVVTLDPTTRQAYVNDVNPVGRFLPSPEWWETPPMSTTTLQFLANGVVTGTPILRAETAAANY
jgi:hypothetical protein